MPEPIINVESDKYALKPRLKLFLSADIIGSTAYKQPFTIQEDASNPTRWEKVIQGFYRQCEQEFISSWASLSSLLSIQCAAHLGEPPRLWKSIGDEVVFWKELSGDHELWLTIVCWMRMIKSIRDDFDKDAPGLDLKCSVWAAEFPVRNKAVALVLDPENPSELRVLNSYYTTQGHDAKALIGKADFIGPGIDVGFRLSKFSSSKKMSMSLDVAYLLARTYKSFSSFENEIRKKYNVELVKYMPLKTGSVPHDRDGTSLADWLCVYFSGNEELKGVLGGILYPKFWVSTIKASSLDAAKEKFYGDKRPALSWDYLESYCDKFYDDRKRFISAPFINSKESVTSVNFKLDYTGWHDAVVNDAF